MAQFLTPSKVVDELNLKPNMIGAEFGCGSGTFALELAKRVPDGLVYGLDIQPEPLSVLESQAKLRGLTNIRTIRCDLEKEGGAKLLDESLDIVLMPNILFQVEDKYSIIKEAWRVLKPGGQLLMLDWLPQASVGPVEGRISAKEAGDLAKKVGFKLKKELQYGTYHWVLLAEK